jgi:hypothetical protein
MLRSLHSQSIVHHLFCWLVEVGVSILNFRDHMSLHRKGRGKLLSIGHDALVMLGVHPTVQSMGM